MVFRVMRGNLALKKFVILAMQALFAGYELLSTCFDKLDRCLVKN